MPELWSCHARLSRRRRRRRPSPQRRLEDRITEQSCRLCRVATGRPRSCKSPEIPPPRPIPTESATNGCQIKAPTNVPTTPLSGVRTRTTTTIMTIINAGGLALPNSGLFCVDIGIDKRKNGTNISAESTETREYVTNTNSVGPQTLPPRTVRKNASGSTTRWRTTRK